MAGGQKQFELLFQLKAALGGNFNGVFRNAIDTQKKLAQSIKQVNSVQGKIDAFTKTNSAIDKNKAKLSELQTEHQKLQQQLQQTAHRQPCCSTKPSRRWRRATPVLPLRKTNWRSITARRRTT